MKPIYFLMALLSFSMNAQDLPSKFYGYWIESSETCKSTLMVNLGNTSIQSPYYAGDFTSVTKINEDTYTVVFYDLEAGEIHLTLNLKSDILEIKDIEFGDDGTISNTIVKYYKICK